MKQIEPADRALAPAAKTETDDAAIRREIAIHDFARNIEHSILHYRKFPQMIAGEYPKELLESFPRQNPGQEPLDGQTVLEDAPFPVKPVNGIAVFLPGSDAKLIELSKHETESILATVLTIVQERNGSNPAAA